MHSWIRQLQLNVLTFWSNLNYKQFVNYKLKLAENRKKPTSFFYFLVYMSIFFSELLIGIYDTLVLGVIHPNFFYLNKQFDQLEIIKNANPHNEFFSKKIRTYYARLLALKKYKKNKANWFRRFSIETKRYYLITLIRNYNKFYLQKSPLIGVSTEIDKAMGIFRIFKKHHHISLTELKFRELLFSANPTKVKISTSELKPHRESFHLLIKLLIFKQLINVDAERILVNHEVLVTQNNTHLSISDINQYVTDGIKRTELKRKVKIKSNLPKPKVNRNFNIFLKETFEDMSINKDFIVFRKFINS